MDRQHSHEADLVLKEPRSSGRLVLIFEEDRQLRAAYEKVLKQHGFAVITAGEPNATIRSRLAAFRRDLVVVHCSELARSCRNDPAFAGAAVLRLGGWKLAPERRVRLISTRCEPEEVLAFVLAAVAHLDGESGSGVAA